CRLIAYRLADRQRLLEALPGLHEAPLEAFHVAQQAQCRAGVAPVVGGLGHGKRLSRKSPGFVWSPLAQPDLAERAQPVSFAAVAAAVAGAAGRPLEEGCGLLVAATGEAQPAQMFLDAGLAMAVANPPVERLRLTKVTFGLVQFAAQPGV